MSRGYHGSYTMWRWHKCPCELCEAAKAAALAPAPRVKVKRPIESKTFDPVWREQAECRRFGPLDWKFENGKTRHMTQEEWGAYIDRVFFVGRGGSQEEAISICARCPVKEACLSAGLVDLPVVCRPPSGIWGGKTQRERIALTGRKFR